MGSSNENSAFEPVPQPLGPRAHARRLVGRQRGGGGGAAGARRAGHRHRRLDPPAGLALRRGRAQAHLRPRLALRRGRLRLVARPGRAARPAPSRTRALLLAAIAGHDPQRLDLRRPARCADYLAGAARAARGGCASACPGSASRAGSSRGSRPRCAAALDELPAHGRDAGRGLAAAHRVRRSPPTTSSRRPRPRPTWPATTACASACAPAARGLAEMYGETRDARLRRRGQAPHHARHLRALAPATTTPTTCRRRRSAR